MTPKPNNFLSRHLLKINYPIKEGKYIANEDPFAILKEHFSKFEEVVVSGPKGAQGIKYNGFL